ncbi:MAG: hypothetical protein IH606_22560 [Burkholderiales bacterium]|nr:hypothetical protein [Burkholderiales bacterium]
MDSTVRKLGMAPPPGRCGIRSAARRTQRLVGRACLTAALLASTAAASQPAAGAGQTQFRSISTRFIAALGDPTASSGSGAHAWGLWPLDPGPRGVELDDYARLKDAGGVAPARWKFDGADWWLEEHGLIMEKPQFPIAPGKYLVTGDRAVTSVLTIHPPDGKNAMRWELANGARLHDVTHLACRSARYRPAKGSGSCTPAQVRKTAFPVAPGAAMPPLDGCVKQDYAVLIVIGVGVED